MTTNTTTTTVETPVRRTSQVGNLTREPVLRYSASGTAWASSGLAVNRRTRKDDGTFEDLLPEFYDLVCFGDLAEHVAESLTKGDRVVVAGRLEEDRYTARDGTERTTAKLVADDIGASLRFATLNVERVERTAPVRKPDGYGYSEEPF
jgi:single-strand DNA-binding protein